MVMGKIKPGLSDRENDRFVDWLYGLVADVSEGVGLPERQSYEVVKIIVDKVQAEYGGSRLYVHSQRSQTSSHILKLWREGKSTAEIARTLSITEDWVYRVLKEQSGGMTLPSSSVESVESCSS